MFIVYLVLGSLCAVITLWFSTKAVLGSLYSPDVTFWTLLKVSVYDIVFLSCTIFFYMAMAGKKSSSASLIKETSIEDGRYKLKPVVIL